jgi:hypothetical protein
MSLVFSLNLVINFCSMFQNNGYGNSYLCVCGLILKMLYSRNKFFALLLNSCTVTSGMTTYGLFVIWYGIDLLVVWFHRGALIVCSTLVHNIAWHILYIQFRIYFEHSSMTCILTRHQSSPLCSTVLEWSEGHEFISLIPLIYSSSLIWIGTIICLPHILRMHMRSIIY